MPAHRSTRTYRCSPRGARHLIEHRVRLRRATRGRGNGLVADAAEAQSRRRRARTGQDGDGDGQAGGPAHGCRGTASGLQPRPPGGQDVRVRRACGRRRDGRRSRSPRPQSSDSIPSASPLPPRILYFARQMPRRSSSGPGCRSATPKDRRCRRARGSRSWLPTRLGLGSPPDGSVLEAIAAARGRLDG